MRQHFTCSQRRRVVGEKRSRKHSRLEVGIPPKMVDGLSAYNDQPQRPLFPRKKKVTEPVWKTRECHSHIGGGRGGAHDLAWTVIGSVSPTGVPIFETRNSGPYTKEVPLFYVLFILSFSCNYVQKNTPYSHHQESPSESNAILPRGRKNVHTSQDVRPSESCFFVKLC